MRAFFISAKNIFTFTREDKIVFFLAISLRLAVFGILLLFSGINDFPFPVIGSDSRLHIRAMQGLLDYHRFIDPLTSTPLSFILPGYPFFLALVTSLIGTIWAVPFIQTAFAGISAVLLFRIGAFLHPIAGWGAALLFIADPAGLYYTNVILTESLFLAFAIIAWYILISFPHHCLKKSLFAGVAIGIAILVRPAGVILIPGAIAFLLFAHWPSARRILCACFLLMAGVSLFLGPWIVRNYIVFREWDISPVASLQYYAAHAPLFYAWREGISEKEAILLFQRRLEAISPYGDEATTPNAPYMRRVAFEYIGQYPIEFAAFYAVKTIPLFFSDGIRELAERLNLAPSVMPNISNLLLVGDVSPLKNMAISTPLFSLAFFFGLFSWALIIFFAVMGAWKGIRIKHTHRPLLISCIVILLVGAMVAGGATSHPRYRHSMSPFIFLLSSFGFLVAREKITGTHSFPQSSASEPKKRREADRPQEPYAPLSLQTALELSTGLLCLSKNSLHYSSRHSWYSKHREEPRL